MIINMIRNVIFDLDGTLLDTINDIAKALNETLVSFELPPVSLYEVTSFIGDGSDMLIKRALKGDRLEAVTLLKFKKQYLSLQLTYQLERTKPFSGILTLIHSLRNQNIRLFVFSNKPHDFVVKLIEARFPNLFTAVLGQKDQAMPKPDITAFTHFAKQHQIFSGTSLFVGDSLVDITTAQNLAMNCVAVTWGYVAKETLINAKPTFVCDTTEELLTIVQKLNQGLPR